MIKHFVPCLLVLSTLSNASETKDKIDWLNKELKRIQSDGDKAKIYYELAQEYFADQELDQAFQYFLLSLDATPFQGMPTLTQEEKEIYEAALADYLEGVGSDPVRFANRMLEKYGEIAEEHEGWIFLNFLLASSYANLGHFEEFFHRFYRAYPFLGETFLAYKTKGILYLRLAQHGRDPEERCAYRQEALACLAKALNSNPKDSSLYKVLIFLAKDEKNDILVLNYLRKIVENKVQMARGDIYPYVQEAVKQGEYELGQRIIDLASDHFAYSRALIAAQEYLNQCKG